MSDYVFKHEKKQISTEITGAEIISQQVKLGERRQSRDLSAGLYAEEELMIENRALKMQLEDNELWKEVDTAYAKREKAAIKSAIVRNKTALLHGDKRSKEDSPEMATIKNCLAALDEVLRGKYDHNSLELVLTAYTSAIESMQYYIDNKNPFFADGKRRKNRVIDLRDELKEEKKKLINLEMAYNNDGTVTSFLDLLEGRSISKQADLAEKRHFSQKRRLMAIKREDGREDEQTMRSIKNAYRALSTLLNSPIADLREQSAQISSQYEALIKCCDDFLRENSGKTENDRMRVREISKLEETFKSELDLIMSCARAIKNDKKVQRDKTWLDAWNVASEKAEAIEKAKPAFYEYMKGIKDAGSLLPFIAALSNLAAGDQKYDIFMVQIFRPWAEENLDNDLLDSLIAYKHDLNVKMYEVYQKQLAKPVPKEFLKNLDDDPTDIKFRKAYTNLVLRAHPIFNLYNAYNSIVGPMSSKSVKDFKKLRTEEDTMDIGFYCSLVSNRIMDGSSEEMRNKDDAGGECLSNIFDKKDISILSEEAERLAYNIDDLILEKSKKTAALLVSEKYFDYNSEREQELNNEIDALNLEFDLEYESVFTEKRGIRLLGFDDFARVLGSGDDTAVVFKNGELRISEDTAKTAENRELRRVFLEACLGKLGPAADEVAFKKLEKTLALHKESDTSGPLPVATIRKTISQIHEEQSEVARVLKEDNDSKVIKSDNAEDLAARQRVLLALAANDSIGARYDSFALMSPSEAVKKNLSEEINKIIEDARNIGMKEESLDSDLRNILVKNYSLSQRQLEMLSRGNVTRIKDETYVALSGICALIKKLKQGKLADHNKIISDKKLMTMISALVIKRLTAETDAGRAAYEYELKKFMLGKAFELSGVSDAPKGFDAAQVIRQERQEALSRAKEQADKAKEDGRIELGVALNDLPRLDANMRNIVRVLLAEKFPSDLIKNDKDHVSMENLLSILRDFEQGKVQVKDFMVPGGKIGRLVQRENGSLQFISEGVHIPIPFTAEVIADRIETDMAGNVSKYDTRKVQALIDGLDAESEDAGIATRSRNICLKVLLSVGNIPSAFFNNVSLPLLKFYASALVSGDTTAEKIMQQVEQIENKKVINGEEALSLLRQKEERRLDVAQKVQFIAHDNIVAVKEDDGWKDDERKVKNLLADMIYSEDTWTHDESLETNDRMQKMMEKNVDAWILLFKDKTLLNRTLDKMPLPGGDEGDEDHSIKGQIKKKFEMITNAKKLLTLFRKVGDDPEEQRQFYIKLFKQDMFKDAFASLEEGLTEAVNAAVDSIQAQIGNLSAQIFKAPEEAPKNPADLPDPNEEGISPEERRKRRKAVEQASEDKLRGMMESAIRGERGQGLFMKLVLNNYFKDVDIIEKKSMLASAIRGSRAVVQSNDQNDGDQLKVLGQYLGGFLKGAGPLLQKMLQGLPDTMVPPELRGAIIDMKSNLSPIPKEIVEAQLYAMVERSKGKITKIEVSRSLGAASVGQAFLCRMYGKGMPEDGEEVVVKLLRPDVRNRMMREKEVMLKWADQVDTNHGQYNTYLGQLARIEEELDLTIEAANIEKGRVYDKMYKTVKAVKVNPNVEPTVNALVLTKASGTTVDKYLEEVKTERLETISKFHRILHEGKKDVIAMIGEGEDTRCELELTTKNCHLLLDARKKMGKLLEKLEKRKEYLMELSQIWVTEGIYGEGYYHGDLHAGNIMFDDNGLTVIDFGNATKLTAAQQEQITRMMLAAAAGDMELFRHGFHMLLENTTPQLYQQKREELGRVFGEVFSLGNKSSAGYRVAVALLKAQELGIELPAAINNFSSGQIRLQNSIDSMNQQIRSVRNELMDLDTIGNSSAIYIDPVAKISGNQDTDVPISVKSIKLRLMKQMRDSLVLSRYDFKEKLKGTSEEERKAFEKEYLQGYKKVRETADIIERAIADVPDLAKKEKDARSFEFALNKLERENYISPIAQTRQFFDPDSINKIVNGIHDALKESYNKPEKFDEAKALVKELRDMGKILDDYEEIRKEQRKEEPNAAYLDQMINNLRDSYEKEYEILSTRTGSMAETRVSIRVDDEYTRGIVDAELQMWFDDKKNFGESLKKAFEEFRAAQKNGESDEVLKKKEDAFMVIFRKAVIVHLGELISECSKTVPDEPIEDFCDVMGGVIESNLMATLSRLSFFKALKLKKKIEE